MVVARPRPAGFEVLLVRRNDRVAFMAGAHVFPGGRVDAADTIADPGGCCDEGGEPARFADLSAVDERPFRVAAARELVEEAGLLLARTGDRALVPAETAAAVRAALAAGEALPALAGRFGFRLALDALVPLAHWVTPEAEPRRYDTRFFLAAAPAGQVARHDAGEMTELAWLAPAEAVARARRGELRLPPPTWTTLQGLARFAGLDEAFAWARATPIARIQPHLAREGPRTTLTLPGDPALPAAPGWETPGETRFVLEEGRGWTPLSAS